MDEEKKPLISIVVPTFNGKHLLEDCLTSIYNKTNYPNYEVIVVDDGSNDGTKKLIKNKFPKLSFLRHQKNKGFAHACNTGLKKAKGDFILLLNNDTIVPKYGWLQTWVKLTKKYPQAGLFGCKICLPSGDIQPTAGYFTTHNFFSWGMGAYQKGYDDFIECDHLVGVAILLRREVLEEVGYFDTNFSPAFLEETDYCIRAREEGYKIIYSPEPCLIHKFSQTTGRNQFWKKSTKHRNRIRFQMKHYPLRWWLFPQTWIFEVISAIYFTVKFGPRYIKEVYFKIIKEILLK